jgi:hypothetical protein
MSVAADVSLLILTNQKFGAGSRRLPHSLAHPLRVVAVIPIIPSRGGKRSRRQFQVRDAEDGAFGGVGEALDFPAVGEAGGGVQDPRFQDDESAKIKGS